MIFIGNFLYVSNQQSDEETERRHGDFTLIVEADSSDEAIALFQQRIGRYKETEKFFEGACRIFFLKLLELNRFPRSQALMINFKSYAGNPILPFIECAIPSDASDGCKISDWSENIPSVDGHDEKIFMEFEG
jgi:hypothetical protein